MTFPERDKIEGMLLKIGVPADAADAVLVKCEGPIKRLGWFVFLCITLPLDGLLGFVTFYALFSRRSFFDAGLLAFFWICMVLGSVFWSAGILLPFRKSIGRTITYGGYGLLALAAIITVGMGIHLLLFHNH